MGALQVGWVRLGERMGENVSVDVSVHVRRR